MKKHVKLAAVIAPLAILGGATLAQEQPVRPSLDRLKEMIESTTPETQVSKVDHERLIVRRLDVVDDKGVIRMSLGRNEAIVDGIAYKRSIPVGGMLLYDDKGSERGGWGYSPANGGAVVFALDHPAQDATGLRVLPDGSVDFQMIAAPPLIREPALGNKLVPAIKTPQRLKLRLAPDGTPLIELSDKQSRPRIRLTVSEDGAGALEFLDADGKVVRSFAPEREALP
ncbi:hypothetical protein [Sphingopyxis sp. R3-92]|uniref:hypothetical protein n=1 Tax=Sphingopyxis sp. R3-92 TaxID=3158553 RepID=UPI003EE4B2A7